MPETSLHTIFGQLSDPRINRQKKHLLVDIVILSILAVLCGAESWDAIELYGKENIKFLKRILRLPGGIPSHDTINRVMGMINSRRFEQLFARWADGLKESGKLELVIALDGKTVRGSKDTFHARSPLHLVHAWSVENEICLGQYKVDGKSNEITAIPELLDLVEVGSAIVTIDAMGTQRAIAEKITEKGGDYILAVKDNQGSLKEEILAVCSRHRPAVVHTDLDKGHGRIETRLTEVFDKGLIVDPEERWAGLKTVVRLTSTREIGGKTTSEVRYYISSLEADKPVGRYIRDHWRVENSLHWTLDVVFREDWQRKRDKQAAENFAIVRKIALNLLKKDPDKKNSLVSKRLKAAWNKQYLINLLKF